MSEFVMPSLGADMAAGTLVEWLKKPGDSVQRGDIVAVVETDKGAIEVEIFEDGVVERLLVDVGKKVPVGTPLALVAAAGAAAAQSAIPAAAVAPSPPPAAPPASSAPLPPRDRAVLPGTRPLASPAARRLAAERGIDLAAIRGSGPQGAIISADLARGPGAAPPAARRGLDLDAMRRAIGAAMARSKREIPHYYLSHHIDMSAALGCLRAENDRRPPPERLLLQALLLKAVALALKRRPEFNGFYGANGFAASAAIHIGTAIAIKGGGLIAPAIHDVAERTLDDLMAALKNLIARARSGTLRSSELSDATITVSALGERGVETLYGVIYPPQVALVGFGSPVERPWAADGSLVPRPVMTVSLAADHRVSDGHLGALFLMEIEKLLMTPATL